MLFNSAIFMFGFLPITLIGFLGLGHLGHRRAAVGWLAVASLVFYAWWDIYNVPLLVVSIGVNYVFHRLLLRRSSRSLLLAGVGLNLAALVYFKYAGFLAATIESAVGLGLPIPHIVLPLAISFYTFQQIAYLCDSYDGLVEESGFVNYTAFITFFPHLIAGPITHHKEIIPQFSKTGFGRPDAQMMAAGLSMFVIGLFKKVIIADTIAVYANAAFAAAARGEALTLMEAWSGCLAYALQIYFDFSGYSDMAIGLGLLFGVRLPFNFDSPLKATNIIDYWARWHMTLTRFVTTYIYSPITLKVARHRIAAGLPMPKRGHMTLGTFLVLVAGPTLVAFFIIGVWHGAGWQFALFGLVHGFFLTANHGWRLLVKSRGWTWLESSRLLTVPSLLLTLACVLIGFAFFRAPDAGTAFRLIESMIGINGLGFHSSQILTHRQVQLSLLLLAIVWLFPNTQEWLRGFATGLGDLHNPGWLERQLRRFTSLAWRPSPAFAVGIGIVGFVAIAKAISAAAPEFIYFNF